MPITAHLVTHWLISSISEQLYHASFQVLLFQPNHLCKIFAIPLIYLNFILFLSAVTFMLSNAVLYFNISIFWYRENRLPIDAIFIRNLTFPLPK